MQAVSFGCVFERVKQNCLALDLKKLRWETTTGGLSLSHLCDSAPGRPWRIPELHLIVGLFPHHPELTANTTDFSLDDFEFME